MAEFTPRSQAQGRTVLADVVPLDTPFVLGIFVGDVCNFRCRYCVQSTTGPLYDKGGQELPDDLVRKFLSWNDFEHIAQQAAAFPQKIKWFAPDARALAQPRRRRPQPPVHFRAGRDGGGVQGDVRL